MSRQWPIRNVIVVLMLALVSVSYTCVYLFVPRCQSSRSFKTGESMKDKDVHLIDLRLVEQNFNSLDQGSLNLVSYTRVKYLNPPSKQPYNLKENDTKKTMTPTTDWVVRFFREKKNGIFIEAGAYDGESSSNTLHLEKQLGWTGVLVECSPLIQPTVLSKHRKAWVASVCVAPKSKSGTLVFKLPEIHSAATIGKPNRYHQSRAVKYFDLQAVPLYTIIAALGWKEVDYFSFDVEGIELEVLRSFPFDKVTFKVITIEHQFYTEQEKIEMTSLLAKNGYIFAEFLPPWDNCYVHQSVKHLLLT